MAPEAGRDESDEEQRERLERGIEQEIDAADSRDAGR
jgi:hypothetical protein